MTRTYSISGNVRGQCYHRHRSIRTAYKCFVQDYKACERIGCYSDRWTLRAYENGKRVNLCDDEKELWTYASEAFEG